MTKKKQAPSAETIKADADAQFARSEKTSPNPHGRSSANPTVISKDGYADPERIAADRRNARQLATKRVKRSFGEGT